MDISHHGLWSIAKQSLISIRIMAQANNRMLEDAVNCNLIHGKLWSSETWESDFCCSSFYRSSGPVCANNNTDNFMVECVQFRGQSIQWTASLIHFTTPGLPLRGPFIKGPYTYYLTPRGGGGSALSACYQCCYKLRINISRIPQSQKEIQSKSLPRRQL